MIEYRYMYSRRHNYDPKICFELLIHSWSISQSIIYALCQIINSNAIKDKIIDSQIKAFIYFREKATLFFVAPILLGPVTIII